MMPALTRGECVVRCLWQVAQGGGDLAERALEAERAHHFDARLLAQPVAQCLARRRQHPHHRVRVLLLLSRGGG